jgi:hypothetical protein
MNLTSPIPLSQVAAVQKKQWFAQYYVNGEVEPQSEKTVPLNIEGAGDFLIEEITGSFETLTLSGADIVDNGICSLSMKIEDNGANKRLMNDFIPLNLMLSPGRVRSDSVTIADTSPYPDPIFVPLSMPYLMYQKSSMSITVKNTSTATQKFAILFWGVQFDETARR